jgi:hypothetical protein
MMLKIGIMFLQLDSTLQRHTIFHFTLPIIKHLKNKSLETEAHILGLPFFKTQ